MNSEERVRIMGVRRERRVCWEGSLLAVFFLFMEG